MTLAEAKVIFVTQSQYISHYILACVHVIDFSREFIHAFVFDHKSTI